MLCCSATHPFTDSRHSTIVHSNTAVLLVTYRIYYVVVHQSHSLLCWSTAGALTLPGTLAGQVLVEVVRAITSLKIAGSQLAAAAANTAFGGLVDKIRWGITPCCDAARWSETDMLPPEWRQAYTVLQMTSIAEPALAMQWQALHV